MYSRSRTLSTITCTAEGPLLETYRVLYGTEQISARHPLRGANHAFWLVMEFCQNVFDKKGRTGISGTQVNGMTSRKINLAVFCTGSQLDEIIMVVGTVCPQSILPLSISFIRKIHVTSDDEPLSYREDFTLSTVTSFHRLVTTQ